MSTYNTILPRATSSERLQDRGGAPGRPLAAGVPVGWRPLRRHGAPVRPAFRTETLHSASGRHGVDCASYRGRDGLPLH